MSPTNEEALAGGAAQGSRDHETTNAAIVAPETFGGKTAHPVASMFPLLESGSDQFKKLVVSIKHNGLWHPIVLDAEGRILDGRNRMRACIEAGVEPKFVNFADLKLGINKAGKPVDEAEYACEENFARRDLTPDQRVMITALYSEYLDAIDRGAPKGNKNAAKKQGDQVVPAKAEPKTRAKLAKKANVSERKAQQALNVGRKKPDLAKKVAAGKMKLSEAAKQAEPKKPKRPPPVQLDLTGLPPPPAATPKTLIPPEAVKATKPTTKGAAPPTNPAGNRYVARCVFCDKDKHQVGMLITHMRIDLCDGCVDTCAKMVSERRKAEDAVRPS